MKKTQTAAQDMARMLARMSAQGLTIGYFQDCVYALLNRYGGAVDINELYDYYWYYMGLR